MSVVLNDPERTTSHVHETEYAAELNTRDWKPEPHRSWPNKDNINLTPTIFQVGELISGSQGIFLSIHENTREMMADKFSFNVT